MWPLYEDVTVVVNGKHIDVVVHGPVPCAMLRHDLNQPPDINSTYQCAP